MGGEITKRTQFFRKKANKSAEVSKKTNPILSLRRGLFGHPERVLTSKARRFCGPSGRGPSRACNLLPGILLNPNSEVGVAIEKTCREPAVVGRVTPCAPRLQPDGTNYPRCHFHNPLKIMAFYKSHRSNFGIQAKSHQIRPKIVNG